MWIGLGSCILAFGLVQIQIISNKQTSRQAIEEIRILCKTLAAIHEKNGAYSYNLKSIAVQSLPAMDLSHNPWGGVYHLSRTLNNQSMFIEWSNVPILACLELTKQLASNFQEIKVNGIITAQAGQVLNSKICHQNQNTLVMKTWTLERPRVGFKF